MTDKRDIVREIKRIAAEIGRPPGVAVFERETGVKQSDWYPHLWLRWRDALEEAGYAPNKLQSKLDDSVVIEKYVGLVRELGRLPLGGEVRRKAKTDKSFPSHTVFSRFGGKEQLIEAVAAFCQNNVGYDDVGVLCESHARSTEGANHVGRAPIERLVIGSVYLMKSGRHHKIGRTNVMGRRERELGIKIPVPPRTVHVIETDDPVGVESYWHRRFAGKRGEGEWFDLSSDDVRAFKRWKRIV